MESVLPGHSSGFFVKISLQLSQTRTGYGQPRAGTGISLLEHWLQKPSPHARQWCFLRSFRSKFILHELHTCGVETFFFFLNFFILSQEWQDDLRQYRNWVSSTMEPLCRLPNWKRPSMAARWFSQQFQSDSWHHPRPSVPNALHHRTIYRFSKRERFRI